MGTQLSRLDHVDIAVLALGTHRGVKHNKCSWLKNNRGQFKAIKPGPGGHCDSPAWLRATGGSKWVYHFIKRLLRGRYQRYVRAVNRGGVYETTFSRRLHNVLSFLVR